MTDSNTPALAAHVSGTVLDVLVGVGDSIDPGAVVLTIECMKMHMPLEAARGGVVAGVLVQPGDEVEEGQPVVTLAAGGS